MYRGMRNHKKTASEVLDAITEAKVTEHELHYMIGWLTGTAPSTVHEALEALKTHRERQAQS